MKVFFLASVTDNKNLVDAYKTIVSVLEAEGHNVNYKHVLTLPDEIIDMSVHDNEERAKSLLKEMLASDCMVLEGTKSSMGAGYYTCLALQRSVPVLFLKQSEYKGLYLASSNRLLKVKKYDQKDKDNLRNIIRDFTRFTDKKRLSNRFNMMISDNMDSYLNKVSNDYGTSKADFIRDLINKEMNE